MYVRPIAALTATATSSYDRHRSRRAPRVGVSSSARAVHPTVVSAGRFEPARRRARETALDRPVERFEPS
ncbi:hypothetical protein BRC90_04210 [Halobacteriales archaeon QS_4_69_34]|nr:MAG: hypothetical protein BRC90_04210 [Halobacteriales archaeon QS_4_69_34]